MNRARPKGKNGKVIGVMKDELGEKIMEEFIRINSRNIQLFNNKDEDKKAKGTKKVCHIKSKFTVEDCKNCLEGTQL